MLTKRILAADLSQLAYVLIQPSRPQLLTTMNLDGSVNASPAGWVTAVSENPPMFAAALLTLPKKKHTIINIERNGEFVINVPGIDIADKLVACSYDYPEGVNKFQMAGFTPTPSIRVTPPGIAECLANLECKVRHMLPTGDHTLVIADLLVSRFDTECFAPDLMPRLDRRFPCLSVKRYLQDKGQSHLLLAPTGLRAVYVPYDPEERETQADDGEQGI